MIDPGSTIDPSISAVITVELVQDELLHGEIVEIKLAAGQVKLVHDKADSVGSFGSGVQASAYNAFIAALKKLRK